MKRNAQLLAAIVERPDDHGPRRVYADWWMEQAEPRGEYVSSVLTLDSRVDPVRRKLARKAAWEVSSKHEKEWTSDLLALGATQPKFSLGFVREVTLAEKSLANLEALLALEPITHLEVRLESGAALAEAMTKPCFNRIRHVAIDGDADGWAEALGEGEDLAVASLEGLVLRQASEEAVQALAVMKGLAKLERLSLTATEAGDGGLAALAAGVLKLKTLYAARSGVTDEGVATLAEGRGATSLEMLALGANELSDDAFNALAESGKLKKLARLELPMNDISADALLALTDAKVLPALKSLDVAGMGLEGELDALHKRFGPRLKV